jgi:hypothetical protein
VRVSKQHRSSNDSSNEQETARDKLLLRLLKTPPQQRPKRERDKRKPIRASAKCASGDSASTLPAAMKADSGPADLSRMIHWLTPE